MNKSLIERIDTSSRLFVLVLGWILITVAAIIFFQSIENLIDNFTVSGMFYESTPELFVSSIRGFIQVFAESLLVFLADMFLIIFAIALLYFKNWARIGIFVILGSVLLFEAGDILLKLYQLFAWNGQVNTSFWLIMAFLSLAVIFFKNMVCIILIVWVIKKLNSNKIKRLFIH